MVRVQKPRAVRLPATSCETRTVTLDTPARPLLLVGGKFSEIGGVLAEVRGQSVCVGTIRGVTDARHVKNSAIAAKRDDRLEDAENFLVWGAEPLCCRIGPSEQLRRRRRREHHRVGNLRRSLPEEFQTIIDTREVGPRSPHRARHWSDGAAGYRHHESARERVVRCVG